MTRFSLLAGTALSALMLGGCSLIVSKTDAVALKEVSPVSGDRILAFQEPAPESGAVTVIRDTGALNKTCPLAIQANGRLIASLHPGESVTFHLPAGRNELGTAHDPKWSGGCSVLAWKSPVVREYMIEAGKSVTFRLSSRSYRRPMLEPYAMP